MLNRLRAAWNVLRGRPTLYRVVLNDHPNTHIHSDSNPGLYACGCVFYPSKVQP